MKKNDLITLLAAILLIFSSGGWFGLNVQASQMDLEKDIQNIDFISELDGEVEATEDSEGSRDQSIKPSNAKILKPSDESEIDLEEAYWYVNDKGEEVQVTTIHVSQADRGKSYDISMNTETNEYEVTESDSVIPFIQSTALAPSINYFIAATNTTLHLIRGYYKSFSSKIDLGWSR